MYKIDNVALLRENLAKNNKNLPGNGNYNILIENLLDRLQVFDIFKKIKINLILFMKRIKTMLQFTQF